MLEKSHRIDVGDVQLLVRERGDGIPLLFIHPPLLSSLNFYQQWSNLGQHFRIILFDIRGHGRSQSSATPLSYGVVVQDMVKILDALGVKQVICCGYSTGTSIALEFALTQRERCQGLILLGGMSGVYDRGLRGLIRLAASLAESPLFPLLAASIAWGNHNNRWSLQKFWAEAKRGDRKNIAQYYRYSLFYDCYRRLKELSCPTLLLCGGADGRFRQYSQLLQREIPQSQLVIIPGAKHQLPTKWAQPTEEAIIQFITANHFNRE